MKILHWSFSLALALSILTSCETQQILPDQVSANSGSVDPADLPSPVQGYVSTNYLNLTIHEAELDDECGNQVYEVELSNGMELYFDLQGNFLGTDDAYGCDDDYVDPATLPSAVLSYISTNYPNASIYEAEQDYECGAEVYEVELDNGVELYFDLQGNFLGTDDTYDCDGDDDDYVDPATLPSAVLSYISTNYPNATISEVEIEDDCDEDVYGVELDNGMELFFDLQGTFLGTGSTYDCDGDDDDYIDPATLPSAVLTYISTNYPNANIYEAEIEDDCEDDDVYRVELDNDVELYFDLQGNFLGTDATYDCDGDDD